MAEMRKTAKKLIMAMDKVANFKITLTSKQFIAREGVTLTYYSLNHAVYNEEAHKYFNEEMYSTTSLVRIVLYLRDGWYYYNNRPLPTDQEVWNDIREGLIASGKYWPQYLSEVKNG